MRELIYDNVRIQFLSEEVLRLEVRYGAFHGSEYALDSGQGSV